MISLTVTYTANLGPESDIPALLHKLAVRLKDAAGIEEPLFVSATRQNDYVVVAEDEWASLSGVLKVSSARGGSWQDGLTADFLAIADAHFAELYARRSIALSFELAPVGDDSFVERRHGAPSNADTY